MTLFWQLGTLKFQIESLIPWPEQRHLKFENVFRITFIEINDRSDDHSTTNSVNHAARFSFFFKNERTRNFVVFSIASTSLCRGVCGSRESTVIFVEQRGHNVFSGINLNLLSAKILCHLIQDLFS